MVGAHGLRGAELAEVFPLVDNHPDVAGLLSDRAILPRIAAALADPFRSLGVTKVVGPETRGMVMGALVAAELSAGLVCARRVGSNHPGSDITVTSDPSWTGVAQQFQLRSFDLSANDVVIAVDDWITTGSSLRAVVAAIGQTEASYLGASVIVDKSTDDVLDELSAQTLVSFDSIGQTPLQDHPTR